jgi:predicted amidohydrolase YtcJ
LSERTIVLKNGTVHLPKGAHVYPALVDAHCHPLGVGERLLKPRLEGTRSKEDVYDILRPLIGKSPWIVSRGWDQNTWSDTSLPTCGDLDQNVSSEIPIALTRIDGHATWCNSKALQIARITSSTSDPIGGAILHDGSGEPTGILLDDAMKLVEVFIPAATQQDIERTLSAGLHEYLKHGVCAVHEMGVSAEVWNAYRSLYEREHQSLPHAYVFLDMTKPTGRDLFEKEVESLSSGLPARMHFAGIKLYLDGALGSRGANLFEDYSDDPGNRGLALMEDEEVIRLMQLATKHSLQIAAHAIGDRACTRALDLFQRAGLNGGNATLRIEHAQIMRDEDVKRMSSLGAYALVQPAFYASDRHWAVQRLGTDRMKTAYRWRSLIAAGVRFVGSSDAPIESSSAIHGIQLLTSRDRVNDGEALTKDESLAAYTTSAYALCAEQKHGASSFALLDRDIFEAGVNVLATIIDGELAYGSL